MAGLFGLLVAAAVGARFADGPVAIFAGGPLESGERVSARSVDDWSFVEPVGEIELQLVEPPRSRTVWVVVHDNALYVPCGFLDWPLWKQWPHEALRDGRAIARILGKRYEFQAVKIDEPELRAALGTRVARKYGLGEGGPPPDPDVVWFFRLDPRS